MMDVNEASVEGDEREALAWREVVRVSAKSVTVTTPYSWTDRIAIDQITDFRIIPRKEAVS